MSSGPVGVGEQGWAVLGEVAFQDEDGGDLVDEVLAVDACGVAGGAGDAAGFVEQGVGLAGGEALIEEVMLQCGMCLAEGVGEGLRFCGLWAGGAVGMEWAADDENLDLVLADETSDGFEVGAERGAVEGEERARGEAELVGDSDADALVADI